MAQVWYVTDRNGNGVSGVEGESKEAARDRFVRKMEVIRGKMKPWLWWKNQGFKLRRRKI